MRPNTERQVLTPTTAWQLWNPIIEVYTKVCSREWLLAHLNKIENLNQTSWYRRKMEFINAVKSKEKGKIDDALKSFLNTVTVSIIKSLIISKNFY